MMEFRVSSSSSSCWRTRRANPRRSSEKKVAGLRARGIYPQDGKEREEDVLRLLQAGEKIMAIRCYRSLQKVGLKEAKDAVELLEKKNA
jgi:ribosomal protein L7/L12